MRPPFRTGGRLLRRRSRSLAPIVLALVFFALLPPALARAEVFGIEGFSSPLGEGESPLTQAGAHPEALTTTLYFNHTVLSEAEEDVGEGPIPIEVDRSSTPRTAEVNLPRGVIVDPMATPTRCTNEQLLATACPLTSAVGVLYASLAGFPYRVTGALYNMVASAGSPGQFAANLVGLGYTVTIDGRVRSDGDYGLSGRVSEIVPTYPVFATKVTLWGDPADPSHDSERGECAKAPRTEKEAGTRVSCPIVPPEERSDVAFLTMPGSCSAQPLISSASVESWAAPEEPVRALYSQPPLTGCSKVDFEPTIDSQPQTAAADSPAGLRFDLHVPQENTLGHLSTANVRDVSVTLPAGMSVNPSSAGALAACSEAQVGLQPSSDETQAITLQAPAQGFTLSFGGVQTPALAPAATGPEVQAALEALPAIGAGSVHVTEASGGWEVHFSGALEHRQVPLMTGEASDDASDHVDVQGIGGTFTLSFKGHSTGPLPFYATAQLVRSELFKLPGLEGNVDVTGGGVANIYTGARDAFTVIFDGARAGKEVPALTATSALTGPGAGVSVTATPTGTVALAVAVSEEGGQLRFSERVENPANEDLAEATICPAASKLGTVEATTPLLPPEGCKERSKTLQECEREEEEEIEQEGPRKGQSLKEKTPITGSIYLAKPLENPFPSEGHPGGSLLAVYLVLEDPERGVIVKLAGHVEVGEPGGSNGLQPGQLRTTFAENPELPVEDIKLDLFGGTRAAFTTPATCGTYTTESVLEPWSHQTPAGEEPGTPDAFPSSAFQVTEAPGGGPCAPTAAQEPNTPRFQVGSVTPTAGAYSAIVARVSREDGSQEFSQIIGTTPPGFTAKIAGVEQCSDAQIAQAEQRSQLDEGALEQATPSCPESSKIGTVTVGVGSGVPLYVSGSAYLAGPYKGAPFSAVFITPAVAGPFDLGTVVVRAGLYINPSNAQVTLKADPLPQYLHGIPTEIRSISLDVNRPEFTLNPTSCAPMTVTGEEISTIAATALMSDRFQVEGCEHLPFAPKLTASVTGQASKADGTSFDVKIGSAGIGQANIHKVDLTIPVALPSRLSTLQKACLAATFEADPAACPEGSVIGSATVHTPLLNSALTGPAYIVSHGGAAFPDVEFVLQGEGITVILDGLTQIKNGVTYSKFETAPDTPFTSFETELPAGPHGILGANVPESEHLSLCNANLAMPTEITAQNGAVIRETTQITPTGCPHTGSITPTVHITKAKIKGDSLLLTVKLGQTGPVKITGTGLKTTAKSLKAGTHTITVPLTAAGRAAKRHRHKVKVTATLTVASKTATTTTTLKA